MTAVTNRRSIMTLYSGALDPNSHRTRIVLAEKGVTFDLLEIEVDNIPEALAEINPYSTVPTLIDRDLVLYESELIMEYLDERFPHPPLMPVYPVARARSRLMMHRINRDWYSLMNKILENQGQGLTADKARKELRESILSVSTLFREMPFFLSEEFSLVDCCLAPLLWRLRAMGISFPVEARGIREYAERIFSRDAFQVSLTPAEKVLKDV